MHVLCHSQNVKTVKICKTKWETNNTAGVPDKSSIVLQCCREGRKSFKAMNKTVSENGSLGEMAAILWPNELMINIARQASSLVGPWKKDAAGEMEFKGCSRGSREMNHTAECWRSTGL